MENTKANTVLNYCNDVFFKYTLSREDEGSVYARNTIIERVTGIKVKESMYRIRIWIPEQSGRNALLWMFM